MMIALHKNARTTPAIRAEIAASPLGAPELVATEHWVGEFKLDIFCTDGVRTPATATSHV
jgi:hypothetical protein